ncbi:MAG: phenylacetate-CoA oxygenase subunit PaaC [Saprospiraceae bacterium]|nr:phenylacetate-CoA oxygenase subunit PaaC [Saprospiraceae bacterium]
MSENTLHLQYILHLADDSLILGHRLSEWCGHGPTLEQDIALTNLALDLVGQARYLFQHAATIDDQGLTEDDLAYFRDVPEFRNHLLVELPNGDFGFTVLRHFLWSTFRLMYYKALSDSSDGQIVSIAKRSCKELAYHCKFSSTWLYRLGLGTETSHRKVRDAVDLIWPYTGEFFELSSYEGALLESKIALDPMTLVSDWRSVVHKTLNDVNIPIPEIRWSQTGGKNGRHTEHLGHVLAEMQFVQRAYPGLEW